MRRDDGFALLEALVALAIAALALSALFGIVAQATLSARVAARYGEAVSRANSHLAAAGENPAALVGLHAGDDGGGYRWNIDVEPVAVREVAGDRTTLYSILVAISWSDGWRQRSVQLETRRIGLSAGGTAAAGTAP